MRKKGLYVLFIISVFLITLFSKFDEMKLMPLTTGEEFLASQPYVMLGDVVWTQPSSTLIVYGLGIFIILLGLRFLRKQENMESRKYWGYSMIYWGIGTILAGTSYQAFGYQLKCVGKEFANFTNWWEVVYMLFMALSFGMMIKGMSYCVASGKRRKILQLLADIFVPVYIVLMTIGCLVPMQILVTYEMLNIFFMPFFIVFFVLNIVEYRKKKDKMNRRFIIIWLLFVLVNVSYYVYYWFGFSEMFLNSTGIWFNQNDVLHVMVWLWMVYIWIALPITMEDVSEKY
jgi:hypothetical protein